MLCGAVKIPGTCTCVASSGNASCYGATKIRKESQKQSKIG